jgi:probable phosphoglycerate mutase
MVRVVVVRHGETAWSAGGRHTGRTDVELTPAGEASARTLVPALAAWRFAHVVTSPLARARVTAALAGFPDAEVDDDLAEWDYGDYEGITTPQIRETVPGWTVWTHPVPGGEVAADVAARADRVLGRLEAVDGDVLVVAHGHLLRALAARWLEQPVGFGARLPLGTACLGVLGHERERRALERWNVPPQPSPEPRGNS